tara:strand:+ start:8378 stop:8818 length:441 start_codon:yes stop_codon:yes gene_type:complete
MATFSITDSSVRDSIFAYFTTNWNTLTPITYDNLDRNNLGEDIDYTNDFIRISLRPTRATVNSIGNCNFRNTGVIFVQIFSISNNSVFNNDLYITRVNEILSEVNVTDNIVLRDSEINFSGITQDTNGVYYQTNISVNYYYDTIRS